MNKAKLSALLSRGQFTLVASSPQDMANLLTSRGFWIGVSHQGLVRSITPGDRLNLEKQVELIFKSAPQVEIPAAPPVAQTVNSIEDRTQKLLSDCDNMNNQCDQLLIQIGKMAVNLTFPVPAQALDVRAALTALGLDPNQMSYQDYVDLLKMQMALGRSMGNQVSYANQT